MKWHRAFGPGLIVTAAFIGPGTVTTASQAGANFGFALLWSVLFAVLATIILQEMAARLGLAGKIGLGDAIRTAFRVPWLKWLACGLVVLAIGFGNAAYQTGNLMGAALGLEGLSGLQQPIWVPILAAGSFTLLFTGTYKQIERVLVILVVLMSIVFVLTAIIVRPPWGDVVEGLLVPRLPSIKDALPTALALIGTTVVPYNLFLHADSVRQKWGDQSVDESLSASRLDTGVAISAGGIITMCIVITAAMTYFGRGQFENVMEVAEQLEPIMGGTAARACFAVGLFAAGLTSAITAPLAGAYALTGVMGWPRNHKARPFRVVWITILLAGLVFALVFGRSPTQTIVAAQLANGLLLPIIAVFLLVVVNRRDLMGKYCNQWRSNLVGGLVVLVVSGLGIWQVWQRIVQ